MRTERRRQGWRELALGSLLLSVAGASSSAFLQEATSDEEHSIYAALLAESPWVRTRTAVVQLETTDSVAGSAKEFEQIAERLKQEFVDQSSSAPLPDELIDSFTELRTKEAHIDGRGFRRSNVVVLSSEGIRETFEGGKFLEGWELLRERYDAGSIFRFSRVAFSADGARAMLAVSESCGPLCGAGEYVLLAKIEGQWSVTARNQVWIS